MYISNVPCFDLRLETVKPEVTTETPLSKLQGELSAIDGSKEQQKQRAISIGFISFCNHLTRIIVVNVCRI